MQRATMTVAVDLLDREAGAREASGELFMSAVPPLAVCRERLATARPERPVQGAEPDAPNWHRMGSAAGTHGGDDGVANPIHHGHSPRPGQHRLGVLPDQVPRG